MAMLGFMDLGYGYFLFRICTSGLPSDVNINIGEMCFQLHKVCYFIYILSLKWMLS